MTPEDVQPALDRIRVRHAKVMAARKRKAEHKHLLMCVHQGYATEAYACRPCILNIYGDEEELRGQSFMCPVPDDDEDELREANDEIAVLLEALEVVASEADGLEECALEFEEARAKLQALVNSLTQSGPPFSQAKVLREAIDWLARGTGPL